MKLFYSMEFSVLFSLISKKISNSFDNFSFFKLLFYEVILSHFREKKKLKFQSVSYNDIRTAGCEKTANYEQQVGVQFTYLLCYYVLFKWQN